jgi:hypothetical protein
VKRIDLIIRHDIQILTVVLLAARVLPAAAADYEQQVNADPKGKVEVVNVSGTIHVSGWDRPEVHVSARLDDSVERVDVQSGQGRTVVKVVLTGLRLMSGGSADLHLRAARQLRGCVECECQCECDRDRGGAEPALSERDHQRLRRLEETPTSNLILQRSASVEALVQGMDQSLSALALQCWPFHRAAMRECGCGVVLTHAVDTCDGMRERAAW